MTSNALRFSYQTSSPDSAFNRSLACAQAGNLIEPVFAVIGGSSGLVLVSRLPDEVFKRIADACADILQTSAVEVEDF